MANRPPKCRKHPNGQAFVQHRSIQTPSHRLYLGKYDSAESWRRYHQFCASLESGGSERVDLRPGLDKTIDELALGYLDFAKRYHSRDGKPTKEFASTVSAIGQLCEMFGEKEGRTFTASQMVRLQDQLIENGYARKSINQRIGRIRRFFRWCCKHDHLPATLYHSLLAVDGLRRGKSGAREPEPIGPVDLQHVDALLPFVSPQIAAMTQIQHLCGMRPAEVCIMRRCDIDTSGEIWLYRPRAHKTDHHGQSLVKAIPRKAQDLIRQFFQADAEAYLFSPQDAEAWRLTHRPPYAGRERKTPVYPSEMRARERTKAARLRRRERTISIARRRYNTDSYRRAINYGFARAKKAGVIIPHWHPHQLRHTIATSISQVIGQQAAQRWLGHTHMKTTEIYAEKQTAELIEIAKELDRRWASEAV